MNCMLREIQNSEDKSTGDESNDTELNERMLNTDDRDGTVLADGVPRPSRECTTEGGRSGDDRLIARISIGSDRQENSEQDSRCTSVVASESGSLCSTLVPVKRGRKKKAKTTRELGKK
ncbi:hypothetical protein PoB_001442600 [Plakobranchus ocellatus]|uniref:Uncharacterized protein n=1 Tax=Plakobranchus ocellatus TaxID=259542 RepID=A0AAV3YKX2_9GAST|nr:hypothetical protein PoB_001442600 [Plakobranchus ocellatus]